MLILKIIKNIITTMNMKYQIKKYVSTNATALSFTHWIWFAMIAEKRRKNCNIAEKFKFNILIFNDHFTAFSEIYLF
jgi:hypothetical protein